MKAKLIHKILVPTDFSSAAEKALNYACSLSLAYNCELLLFHVNEAPVMLTNELAVSADYSGMEKELSDKLEALKSNVEVKYPGLKCSVSHTIGVAAAEIINATVKENVDIVVMGTNGASGLSEVMIGSITQRVSSKCECPVLAVPANAPAKQPDRVAFATNFDDHELQSIFLLTELVRPFDTEIALVHIGDAANMKKENQLMEYFKGQVITSISYDKLKFELITGSDIEGQLVKYIADNKIDWLALAKRKRNLFDLLTSSSLSKKLTFHSHIPILVFHTTVKSGTPLF